MAEIDVNKVREKTVDIIDTSNKISAEELIAFLKEIAAMNELDIEELKCDTKIEGDK